MAQKIIQTQALQQTQTLSPQQVLQVKLLEMPIAELEQRVKNELMENGALEESVSPADRTKANLTFSAKVNPPACSNKSLTTIAMKTMCRII